MTRPEWQRMAGERVRDASALLKVRRWSAAYYLAGYAVECGLKACIVVLCEEAHRGDLSGAAILGEMLDP